MTHTHVRSHICLLRQNVPRTKRGKYQERRGYIPACIISPGRNRNCRAVWIWVSAAAPTQKRKRSDSVPCQKPLTPAEKSKNKAIFEEKKEEIWLSPMTKAHTPTEMSKRQSDNINSATKKFDYTAVADRLRTVSWSNYRPPNWCG